MNILYIENSGIGNMVNSFPLFKLIKKNWPDSQLTVLGWKRTADIAKTCLAIDEFKVAETPINFNALFDYILISPVGALLPQNMPSLARKVINNPVTPPWTKHESVIKAEMIKRMGGIIKEVPLPKMEIPAENINKAIQKLSSHYLMDKRGEVNDFICINASYLHTDQWYLKHFGDDKYVKLIDRIPYENIVLIGSIEDYGHCEKIAQRTVVKCLNFCGWSNDILDTAALISMSKMVVGNDGGLMHIAAALRIKTTTIFTFTNSVKNSPLGSHNENVMINCEDRLTCQHSGNYNNCKCLDIPIDEVFNAVNKQLLLSR